MVALTAPLISLICVGVQLPQIEILIWLGYGGFICPDKNSLSETKTLNGSRYENQSWRNLSKTSFVFLISPWSEFQRYKDSAESLEEHLQVIVPSHKVSTSVDGLMVYCSKPEVMKKQSGSSKIHEKWISLSAAWSGSRSSALQHELKEVRIPQSHGTRVFPLWAKFNYPKTGVIFLKPVNGPVACWPHGPFSGVPIEKPFDLENRRWGLSVRFHLCWRRCQCGGCPLSICNPLRSSVLQFVYQLFALDYWVTGSQWADQCLLIVSLSV